MTAQTAPSTTAPRLSARNQFSGTVSRIKEGNVMAEVVVKVEGVEFVAAITAASARDLQLKVDDHVTIAVKATEVLIAK